LTSLTAIFGSSTEKPEENEMESEKLLNLYWNRAELKKEFAELRSENFQLQERVKEHEGATARVQQKLEQLENLLLDPAWVYNTVTYFQLQGLNLKCEAKVAKFAEQLKRQREQRLQSQLVDGWNERRSEEAVAVEQQIGEQRLQAQMLEDRLQAERHRLATMSGFMKIFRGRSLTASLDRIAENIHAAQRNESMLFGELAEIQDRDPPDTQGLDVATKRMINFMILAFAQQQYLALRENDIASLAKESGEKSIGAINYGGKETCEEILGRVLDRLDALSKLTDFAADLQTRAKLIADNAKFRDQDDAVPAAASVSVIYEFASDGAVKESQLNLLGENYWGVSSVVCR
jgi:hypothetical protein